MSITDTDNEKWPRVQARLRAAAGEEEYSSFLASLRLEDVRQTRLYCSVPTTFLRKWIEDHYAKLLVAAIMHEYPEVTSVYVLKRTVGAPVTIEEPAPAPEEPEQEQAPPPEDARNAVHDCTAATEVPQQEGQEGESAIPPPTPLLVSLDPDRRIYIEEIQQNTGRWFKVPRKLMLSEKRARNIVRPRMIGMFLSKHMTDRSLPEIGRRFGGRDHTTVLHSVRKITELIFADSEFAYEVASLEAQIRQRELA